MGKRGKQAASSKSANVPKGTNPEVDMGMSRKLFIFFVGLVAVLCGLISWILPTRILQSPDSALAWLATLTALVVWTQTVSNLRGISFYLQGTEGRKTTDRTLVSTPKGRYKRMLAKVHWVSLGLILFLLIQLGIGTVRAMADERNETRQEQAISTLVSKQQDLIERMDKLISLVEAQNAAINSPQP